MFLKRLELSGFKSFALKTVLEFPSGITAIVGPNGSGKSNVIDAIRWVLGERDAKNLRGARGEDLIFNGSEHRARTGMAQVSIQFDNSSGFFPVDFKDVVITRRIDRDGETMHSINKAEVRLKDVIEFFSKSRMGTRGITIINQGNSDLFVRATPDERRAMIEEVIGLREFQLKKSESERKLEHALVNLEKVKAAVEEVRPRLQLLKRQVHKWEKRFEIQSELSEKEEEYFSCRAHGIAQELEKIAPALHGVELEIAEAERTLAEKERAMETLEFSPKEKEELAKVRHARSELLGKIASLERELARAEARIEVLSAARNADVSHGPDQLTALIEEIRTMLARALGADALHEIKARVREAQEKITSFFSAPDRGAPHDARDLMHRKAEYQKELRRVHEEAGMLEEKENKLASALEEMGGKLKEAFADINAHRALREALEGRRNALLLQNEKVNFQISDLKEKMNEAGKDSDAYDRLMRQTPRRADGIDLKQGEERITRLRAELARIGEIDESLVKEAKEVEAHYEFLAHQSSDLESATKNLSALIGELNATIKEKFAEAQHAINKEFNHFFRLMFQGGNAQLKVNESGGIEIDCSMPKKRIGGLAMLSGGEKSLVSIAALFALISVSPPPFLVLDEIDAALDEDNLKRFSGLIKDFSSKTQFIIVTHNRITMEAADVLYGVTIQENGTSKVLSVKLGH